MERKDLNWLLYVPSSKINEDIVIRDLVIERLKMGDKWYELELDIENIIEPVGMIMHGINLGLPYDKLIELFTVKDGRNVIDKITYLSEHYDNQCNEEIVEKSKPIPIKRFGKK
jgi:hypothetical protein